ncbi:MAG: hypothetical protein K6T77_01520 [candidate division WOR-3 bacterium]|jgi:hypothetical protein|nr:hypothetical protein [candidate division WOR-3 bacterium]MCR4424202.1 hypothetical protein [candidate division WOR-3 bacterium]MDH7519379.1 hypothetical protein [bacterium]
MMCLLILISSLNFKNEVGVSGDYFQQRYTVIDTVTRDTSSLDSELRLFWDCWLTPERVESDRIGFSGGGWSAGNAVAFSTRALRDRLNLNGTLPINPWLQLRGGYDGELRYYHPGFLLVDSSISYASYLNSNLKVGVECALGKEFTLNLNEALEVHRYLPEDSGNNSYLLNRVRLGSELNVGEVLFLVGAYGYNRLFVPQKAGDNYIEHTFYVAGENYFAGGSRISLDNYFTRRRYPERAGSYREEHPAVTFTWDFGENWALTVDEDFRLTQYDETTTVYQNQLENRLGLEGEWRLGSRIVLRSGPQLELSRNVQRRDAQDYNQWAISLGGEVFTQNGLGLTIEDRLGTRRYLAADSGFQSDYRFNEFNLFVNGQLLTIGRGKLILEGMIDIAPEWHSEAIDNLAAFSYSLGLKFQF